MYLSISVLTLFSCTLTLAQSALHYDSLYSLTKVFDDYPVISPDGRTVLFHSDRMGNNDIYLMNLDGSNLIRLTDDPANDRTPSWSPDGQHIAFVSTRDSNYDVFVMDKGGRGQKNLTKNPLAKDIHPYWSKDGRQILFNSSRKNDTYDLYMMNADGHNQRQIRHESGEATHAQFSPDGNKIVFRKFIAGENSNSEIFIMNSDGTNELRVTNNTAFDYAPVFSADGTCMAFVSDRDIGRDAVYVLDIAKDQIIRAIEPKSNQSILSPSWVGSKQLLVVIANETGSSVHRVVLKN